MKGLGMGAALAAAALLALPAWPQAPDLERMDLVLRSVPDGPVAKVDGVNIPKGDYIGAYQAELTTLMLRLKTREIPDRLRVETGVRCVALLVQRELLLQESARRGLAVSDGELEARWNKEMERLEKANKRRGGAAEDVMKMTDAGRKRARAELRQAMLVEAARRQIGEEQQVAVKDAEVKEFYDANRSMFERPEALRLKQIFINARKGDDDDNARKRAEARERIAEALMRVQAGETFDAVARDVSEAPDRERGGDMGTVPVGALPPFFADPAASMKPGDISDIIESDVGWHVFMLVESVSGGTVPLDKAEKGIRQILESQKLDEAVVRFCEPFMKEPGRVQVYLQLEKTLATHPGFEEFKPKKASREEG